MAETSTEYEVLAHFRVKDPKTGKSVSYDPDGAYDPETGLGWGEGPAAARKTFRGDPNSDQVKELLDGAGGVHGPLIAEKKSASSGGSSTSSTSANKEN